MDKHTEKDRKVLEVQENEQGIRIAAQKVKAGVTIEESKTIDENTSIVKETVSNQTTITINGAIHKKLKQLKARHNLSMNDIVSLSIESLENNILENKMLQLPMLAHELNRLNHRLDVLTQLTTQTIRLTNILSTVEAELSNQLDKESKSMYIKMLKKEMTTDIIQTINTTKSN